MDDVRAEMARRGEQLLTERARLERERAELELERTRLAARLLRREEAAAAAKIYEAKFGSEFTAVVQLVEQACGFE